MSSGPGDTAGDRSSPAPRESGVIIDRMTSAAVEGGPAEPSLGPSRGGDHVKPVAMPLRVLALVMATAPIGLAGWILWFVYTELPDEWAGLPRHWGDISVFLLVCLFIIALLYLASRLYAVARSGVEPRSEHEVMEAVASRAFIEAVERYDRQLEAQRLAAEEAGGGLNAAPHDSPTSATRPGSPRG